MDPSPRDMSDVDRAYRRAADAYEAACDSLKAALVADPESAKQAREAMHAARRALVAATDALQGARARRVEDQREAAPAFEVLLSAPHGQYDADGEVFERIRRYQEAQSSTVSARFETASAGPTGAQVWLPFEPFAPISHQLVGPPITPGWKKKRVA